MLNLKDKLPKRLHAEVSPKLYELYQAPSRERCEVLRDELAAWLRAERQAAAAETLYRDWEDFVTFYDFPEEHWLHIRTTNPLESVFAGVRLRSDVAKRARRRENALYLVYKIVRRLSHNWRGLNGGPRLMRMLLAGAVFKNGVLMESDQTAEVMSA